MSIFSAFSGSVAATKLSNTLGRMWRDLINYLIFRGLHLNRRESFYVLAQAHHLVFFAWLLKYGHRDKEKNTVVEYLLHKNITTILVEVWGQECTVGGRVEEITVLTDGLSKLYGAWQDQVFSNERNARLVGSGNRKGWVEAALADILENIRCLINTDSDIDGDHDSKRDITAADMVEMHNLIVKHLEKLM